MSFAMAQGLRGTLPQVFGKKAALADHFFDSILHSAPEMLAFFPHHYGRRKDVFVTLLTKIALCAECPPAMDAIALQMIDRHKMLGVRPVHYEIGRKALIDALETTLSDRLSRAELDRWAEVITQFARRLSALVV